MLILNKLLPIFFLPLGIASLLLLLALWRKQRWPVLAALGVLWAASTPWCGVKLLTWVESAHPAVPLEAVEPADAVIVLGGILGPRQPDGYVTNFSESVERFEAGVQLVQARKASFLVFTGARLPWESFALTEGAQLQREAIRRGVDPAQILVTDLVQNTADEAQRVAELMRARGWKRVILVTTGWHMRRSAYQFTRAGVTFTAFPVDFRGDQGRRAAAIDFIPRADGLWATETALRETYGYLFYRIFR